MAPKLYLDELSPPVRSVLVTIEALGIKVEKVHVDLIKKEQLLEGFVQKNPQHTLPTLDDDGYILWNSHAINTYLIDKYGKDDSLYPKDLKKRGVVNMRLFFDDGILFPAMRSIGRPMLLDGVKTVSQEKQDTVSEAFQLLDTFLKNAEWIAGDQLTVADINIATSVEALANFVPVDGQKFPRLEAWLKRVLKLPYFAVNENGAKLLKKTFQELMSK